MINEALSKDAAYSCPSRSRIFFPNPAFSGTQLQQEVAEKGNSYKWDHQCKVRIGPVA